MNYWTHDEKKKFLKALELFGKDWYKVSKYLGNKDRKQCKAHSETIKKKYRLKPSSEGAHILSIL